MHPFNVIRRSSTVGAVSVRTIRTPGGQKRWKVMWREGGRGSRQRSKTFTNERDAKRLDVAIRRAKDLGQLAAEVVGSEQTVAAFLEEWWEKYAQPYLKPGTRATYAYTLDRWIVPYLGRLRLRDVSRETIDAWVASMRSAGAGTPTVNRALGILQGVMRRGVEWRRVPSNPSLAPPGSRTSVPPRSTRAPEIVEAIRAQLGRQDAALVSVLAYEGLRLGEAFALTWRDVLDERGLPRERLRVLRALSDHEESTTKAGRAREPELFGPVAAELAELYLARGRPATGELVFPTRAAATSAGRTGASAPLAPAFERAGVEYFRPHDLRHTAATLLIYGGRPVTEVADHLGHADAGFTARVYAHVLKDAARQRQLPIEHAISAARRVGSVQGEAGG
jgi:integrase